MTGSRNLTIKEFSNHKRLVDAVFSILKVAVKLPLQIEIQVRILTLKINVMYVLNLLAPSSCRYTHGTTYTALVQHCYTQRYNF